MVKRISFVTIAVLSLVLAGCGGMKTDERAPSDYKEALISQQHDQISSNKSSLYPVHNVTAEQLNKNESPSIIPPGSVLMEKQKATIAKQHQEQLSAAEKQKDESLKIANLSQHFSWIKSEKNTSELFVKASSEDTIAKIIPALNRKNYRILRKDLRESDVFVLDTTSSKGRIDEATPLYKIHVSKVADKLSNVVIFNEKNVALDKPKADKILTAISGEINKS